MCERESVREWVAIAYAFYSERTHVQRLIIPSVKSTPSPRHVMEVWKGIDRYKQFRNSYTLTSDRLGGKSSENYVPWARGRIACLGYTLGNEIIETALSISPIRKWALIGMAKPHRKY